MQSLGLNQSLASGRTVGTASRALSHSFLPSCCLCFVPGAPLPSPSGPVIAFPAFLEAPENFLWEMVLRNREVPVSLGQTCCLHTQ